MKRLKIALFAAATLYASLPWAKPAAWYLWRSPSNNQFICAQITPGDDWVVLKGPFKDARCQKPGMVR